MLRILIYQSADWRADRRAPAHLKERPGWIGFSQTAPSTPRSRARDRRCSCFTRCCRTAPVSTPSRRSLQNRSRVIVPELPGFGRSQAVSGGLAAVADRMAEAVKDAARGEEAIVLGNGYGGFVALQMAIRHPGIAAQVHSRRLRRGVFGSRAARPFATWRRHPRPRALPRSPMSRCAGCSRRNSRRSIRT